MTRSNGEKSADAGVDDVLDETVANGRRRVVVEDVSPLVDGGRFPVKRVVGDVLRVEADVFCDGHDRVAAAVVFSGPHVESPERVEMAALGNDRFRAEIPLEEIGRWSWVVEAWIDRFSTWRSDFEAWVRAGEEVEPELRAGAELALEAAENAPPEAAEEIRELARRLETEEDLESRIETALSERFEELVGAHWAPPRVTRSEPELEAIVDRRRARFSAWYELFPRSASPEPGRHGTIRDVIGRLDHVARMGFDVLYLPPIHPIGRTNRKGKNNARRAEPGDPGSPWAIGGAAGGHDAVHPELGTLEDFRALVEEARERGIDVALDLALQCSPDHPWTTEHPDWFRQRPDGSIRYAENPPKRYEDIYPLDFECEDWKSLWRAIRDVVEHWVEQGVRVFRVDNPHTKPFALWEWLIGRVKEKDPEVVFLAEAFTRPKIMYRLAKLGFSQSYTYFAWRTTAEEIRSYAEEVSTPPVSEYFRANYWPNTPDILTEQLQLGGRAAFVQRLVLAATLSPSYGIYGPAFELMESTPRHAGSEEYRNSEKYQIRHWEVKRDDSLSDLVGRLNRLRKNHPVLQVGDGLAFHECDDPHVLCYTRGSGEDALVVVVSTDPYGVRGGRLDLDLELLELERGKTFQVHELLTDARYLWMAGSVTVDLHPENQPAMILSLRRRRRSEKDFDYYF